MANNQSDFYEIKHKQKSVCLIINIENFANDATLKRNGAELDVANLNKTFNSLNFSVTTRTDLTADQMKACLDDYAQMDQTNMDMFVCVIMSHGDNESILGTDLNKYTVAELIAPIKRCPTLANKPKLFFLQACRGNESMKEFAYHSSKTDYDNDYIPHQVTTVTDGTGSMEAARSLSKAESESHYLIFYSTIENHVAMRSPTKGSVFIKAICQVLNNLGHEKSLSYMLLRIKDRIARKSVQVSQTVDTLRKEVVFKVNKLNASGSVS